MNSLRFLRVPLWNTIKYRGLLSKLDKYGNIFTNPEEERCRVQQWPTTGWRNMEDGLSGGDNTTSGNFTLYWKDNRFYATNSGVKDGDYCFAWNRLTSFLHENTNIEYHHYHLHDYNNIYFHNEINYHACGSQLFYSEHFPLLFLVAKPNNERHSDTILPRDFEAFLIPPKIGVHLNAFVWHSPPILPFYDETATVYTQQAKVHSKIYYHPLAEHHTILYVHNELIPT